MGHAGLHGPRAGPRRVPIRRRAERRVLARLRALRVPDGEARVRRGQRGRGPRQGAARGGPVRVQAAARPAEGARPPRGADDGAGRRRALRGRGRGRHSRSAAVEDFHAARVPPSIRSIPLVGRGLPSEQRPASFDPTGAPPSATLTTSEQRVVSVVFAAVAGGGAEDPAAQEEVDATAASFARPHRRHPPGDDLGHGQRGGSRCPRLPLRARHARTLRRSPDLRGHGPRRRLGARGRGQRDRSRRGGARRGAGRRGEPRRGDRRDGRAALPRHRHWEGVFPSPRTRTCCSSWASGPRRTSRRCCSASPRRSSGAAASSRCWRRRSRRPWRSRPRDAVVVTGEPGSGKSRLVREVLDGLRRRREPAVVLSGRADSTGGGSPYGIIADAIRERGRHPRRGDSLAAQRDKLVLARLRRCPRGPEPRAGEPRSSAR